MSYQCTKHGWSHLLQSCPSCQHFVTTTGSTLSASPEREEPREWFIDKSYRPPVAYEAEDGVIGLVHVIEKSAYLAICQERDSLAQEVIDMSEQLDGANEAGVQVTMKLQDANERITELERELEERRVATPTMNVVHELATQLDSARAAIKCLRSAGKSIMSDLNKKHPDWRKWTNDDADMQTVKTLEALEHALDATSGYRDEE